MKPDNGADPYMILSLAVDSPGTAIGLYMAESSMNYRLMTSLVHRQSEHVAVMHRHTQLVGRGMRQLRSHAVRAKWERAQMHEAMAMHGRFLLERCTAHLMQLGQARLRHRISTEVDRQTAEFAETLMLVAPFAMHWLLVTRRSKTQKRCAHLERVLQAPGPQGLENDSCVRNMAQDVTKRAEALTAVIGLNHGRTPWQEIGIGFETQACTRRQVCGF